MMLSGCATQRAKFSEEFSKQLQLQQELRQQQTPEMAQSDQQRTERANAELGKLIQPVPRTEITPLKMSNGLPSKPSEPRLPIMTGAAIPTGRMKLADDGTTYYEMRSVNGVLFWAKEAK